MTEQRLADVALQASEERYRSLVTATALIVWTTDADGEIVGDIPTWRDFTGQSLEQIAGRGWLEAVHPEDRERTAAVWSVAVSQRTVYETEYRLRRRDGEYRVVRDRGVPVLAEDGGIREWVGACEDVTERREAQKRGDATKALLQLFAAATSRTGYLEDLTRLLGEWTGSRCVGIRVVDGQRNIPYEAYSGFDPEFWEKESCLSLDRDECACTRVIRGAPEPQDLPVTTSGGSFHCPDAPRFINGLTPEQRARFRGTCVKQGFESVTIIPVRYHDRVLGAIHLADETPNAIPAREVGLIESLSPLVGEAVNHFTLEEELRRHANEQAALFSVTSAAMTLLDSDSLVAAALDAVLPVVCADAGWVVLPGSETAGQARIPAYRGVPESFVRAETSSPLCSCQLCSPFLAGKGPRVEPTLLAHCPRIPEEVISESGLLSHVGVPLAVGDQLLGILSLAWRDVHNSSPAERALLLAIGGQIGVALEKARLYEAEQSARQTADTLREASLILTETLDLDTVVSALLENLGRLVPYTRARAFILDGESRLVMRAARDGDGVVELPAVTGDAVDLSHDSVLGCVLASRRGLLIPDIHQHAEWTGRGLPESSHGWMGVPLIAGGNVIGLYTLTSSTPGFFTQAHLRTAEALSAQAAAAIHNAWLFDQVRTARERLKALSRELVEAQEGERRRIARQLHDETGQDLASLKVGLLLLERESDGNPAVARGAAELRRKVDEVFEQVHTLAAELRPASLDHLGLVAALRELTSAPDQQSGPKVLFEAVGLGTDRLQPPAEIALYRIAQEALTNTMRHGGASRVSVVLQRTGDRLIMLVEDDGVGFDCDAAVATGRLGVVGMRERAEMLGGTLRVDSSPGRGTAIVVEVPFVPAPARRR